ncbi:MAG: hypothetical protein AAFR38_08450 [Planctomycetota bacterium]
MDTSIQPRTERLPYTAREQAVEIEDPTGHLAPVTAEVVDISAHGVCLRSRPFVYPDRRCRVLLIDRDGGPMLAEGMTLKCEYVPEQGHLVQVRFTHPIDPADFVGEEVLSASSEPAPVQHCSGVALLVTLSSDKPDHVGDALVQLGMQVERVDTVLAARKRYEQSPIDTLVEVAGSSVSALSRVVKSMRREGFDGPVVVQSQRGRSTRSLEAAELGRLVIMRDVSGFDTVLELLSNVVAEIEFPTSAVPLQGPTPATVGAAEASATFVMSLKRAMAQAQRAFIDGRTNDTLKMLQPIERAASEFGFEVYARLLTRIERLLIENPSDPTILRDPMRKALHMTSRLRATALADAPGAGS